MRKVSENGLPAGGSSQLDSGTPATGFGPIDIFSDPSGSRTSGE
jgi:hypothetical protein